MVIQETNIFVEKWKHVLNSIIFKICTSRYEYVRLLHVNNEFLCTFDLSAINLTTTVLPLPYQQQQSRYYYHFKLTTCDSNDPANTPSVMSSEVAVAPLTVVPWRQWCHVSYGPDEVLESITLPVTKVVITMENNFDSCRDREECSQRMREVQAFYTTNLSSPSIPYK